MHYQFPIEQIATTSQTRFQSGFARMAMYLLPKLDDVTYEPTSVGLRILGSDESALVIPAEILTQIYGEEIRLSKPRIRMVRDTDGVKEPVMNIRVSAPVSVKDRVLDDLSKRQSSIQEVDQQPESVVIRGQAPLRALLGYRQVLAGMTANTANLWVWLSHYARVSPPDGDAA